MQSELPRIIIIVLNWNGKSDTLDCLESLRKIEYPNFDIVVVDNASSDDSIAAIGSSFPDVRIIKTKRNLGFAGGNNVGIQYALNRDAGYILLLNNDTVVDPLLLDRLVVASKELPPGTVLGAKIYFFDPPNKIWYAGARDDGYGFFHVDEGVVDDPGVSVDPYETDYVSGCALLISRGVIEKIGLMDERFFLYYEETDWCYRARNAGFPCYVVPDAKVWHKVSGSAGGTGSPMQAYFLTRNQLLWAERNLPRDRYWRMLRNTWREVMPGNALRNANFGIVRSCYWGVRSWWNELGERLHEPTRRAKIIALRDYVLRRFGDCPDAIRSLRRVRVH